MKEKKDHNSPENIWKLIDKIRGRFRIPWKDIAEFLNDTHAPTPSKKGSWSADSTNNFHRRFKAKIEFK